MLLKRLASPTQRKHASAWWYSLLNTKVVMCSEGAPFPHCNVIHRTCSALTLPTETRNVPYRESGPKHAISESMANYLLWEISQCSRSFSYSLCFQCVLPNVLTYFDRISTVSISNSGRDQESIKPVTVRSVAKRHEIIWPYSQVWRFPRSQSHKNSQSIKEYCFQILRDETYKLLNPYEIPKRKRTDYMSKRAVDNRAMTDIRQREKESLREYSYVRFRGRPCPICTALLWGLFSLQHNRVNMLIW